MGLSTFMRIEKRGKRKGKGLLNDGKLLFFIFMGNPEKPGISTLAIWGEEEGRKRGKKKIHPCRGIWDRESAKVRGRP